MKGEIRIQFDSETGQIMLQTAMETQEQKDYSIGILLSAIKIIVQYKPSAIIKPPAIIAAGNGKTH